MAQIKSEKGKGGNFKVETVESTSRSSEPAYNFWEHKAFLAGIGNAIRAGCFVGIALTSDGGAHSLTIMDGNTKRRTYLASRADVDECATALRDLYSDAGTLRVLRTDTE